MSEHYECAECTDFLSEYSSGPYCGGCYYKKRKDVEELRAENKRLNEIVFELKRYLDDVTRPKEQKRRVIVESLEDGEIN